MADFVDELDSNAQGRDFGDGDELEAEVWDMQYILQLDVGSFFGKVQLQKNRSDAINVCFVIVSHVHRVFEVFVVIEGRSFEVYN